MLIQLARPRTVQGKALCYIVLATFAVRFVACSAPRPAPVVLTAGELQGMPPGVQQWAGQLAKEGERNAVLNMTQIAAEALRSRGQISPDMLARAIDMPLDESIRRIEAVYANTPEARKARSYWHEEASKDFKGEPYERAFVFLLRGLRYYEAGDFQNARACFKSGLLQDSLSVEGEFNADMAALEYLNTVCCLKLGDEAEAQSAFERAGQARATRMRFLETQAELVRNSSSLLMQQSAKLTAQAAQQQFQAEKQAMLARAAQMAVLARTAPQRADAMKYEARRLNSPLRFPHKDDNALIVVFAGTAPAKMAMGKHNEILLYQPGKVEMNSGSVIVPVFGQIPGKVSADDLESFYYQAITRGGRAVDEINKKKAVAKDAAEATAKVTAAAAGGVLLSAGMVAAMSSGGDRDAAIVLLCIAAALILISATAYLVEEAIESKADTRTIHAVPSTVFIWSGRIIPGTHEIPLLTNTGSIGKMQVAIPYSNDHVVIYQFNK